MRESLSGFAAIVNNKAFAGITGLSVWVVALLDKLEQGLEIGIAFLTFILVAWNVHDRVKRAIRERRDGSSSTTGTKRA
jgi:hypothetical protein